MLRLFGRQTQALLIGLRSLSTAAPEFLGRPLPSSVTIVEVGPRDGLQNEAQKVPTDVKVQLIDQLTEAGLPVIESTSFVSPKWVPQLADAADVLASIQQRPGVRYPVLAPNMKGFENALKAGAKEVAIFTAASEAFNRKNLNCSVDDSLRKFDDIMAAAKQEAVAVRGYVSCVVGCPYQVASPCCIVSGRKVAAWGQMLTGSAKQCAVEVARGPLAMKGARCALPCTLHPAVAAMFEACKQRVPVDRLAAHMHDTYGQALANILASLQMGISVVDSSVAGLGGCPYAKGATGNVATEDVVYMLTGFGIRHGVDMDRLLDASHFICQALGKRNSSRAADALLKKRQSRA